MLNILAEIIKKINGKDFLSIPVQTIKNEVKYGNNYT